MMTNYSLTNSFEFYNQLALMRFGFEADYWIAPLLRYYEKYKKSELLKFLYLLDAKFSSDWIIGLSPTDRIENTNAIIKEIETASDQNSLFASPAFKVDVRIFSCSVGRNLWSSIRSIYPAKDRPCISWAHNQVYSARNYQH